MNAKVLFVGDVNVDLMMGGLETPPAVDREVTCSSFTLTMGSSVVIAAANFAGLGGTAAAAGLAGDDEYGKFMIAGMKERAIDTELVQVTSETGTGVTVNLIYEDTRTQITYPGTIATFEDISAIEAQIDRFAHFHFSGIYQQHKFRPQLAKLLMRIRSAGATASLDPQWDPSEQWEGLNEWLPLLDYFFVNEDEALSITGEKDALAAYGRLETATGCLIGKLGSRGAIISEGGRPIIVPSFEVPVRDTTGAGDAFAAGVLYGRLVKELSLFDSVRLANAVAARNCMEEGGINSCPSYEQILLFLENHSE